ncbi:expressed unknown protein [Seminavis robusta]|uniref:Uncharacterized protein n=1 Tax=Seminavis robusta TaxID=568900 RepID=A0A9N8H7X0_9STRA|nr:expressed unknown protein [Seminavis robusta]|eukprot:Sro77_g042090.1 n/a (115) ;mRNA; r:68763-69276
MVDGSSKSSGGLKGFFQKAYNSLETLGKTGGGYVFAYSMWAAKTGGTLGFYFATTAMVTFMPLLFEISRERQQLETERSLVKDLRSQGFGDRQLQEMGFTTASIHEPSVASLKK